jgi:phage tail P2-like protein
MKLLPPNATPQEQALEKTASRISDVPVPLRTLWNPRKCPSNLLPWLAWALSVDEWNTEWSEEQKRNTIAASIQVHREKGTIGAVRKALEPFGLSNTIQEWWQMKPRAKAHTFKLVLLFITLPAHIQDSIIAAVHRAKPVRSQMTVEAVGEFLGQVNIIGILRPTLFTRISAQIT